MHHLIKDQQVIGRMKGWKDSGVFSHVKMFSFLRREINTAILHTLNSKKLLRDLELWPSLFLAMLHCLLLKQGCADKT